MNTFLYTIKVVPNSHGKRMREGLSFLHPDGDKDGGEYCLVIQRFPVLLFKHFKNHNTNLSATEFKRGGVLLEASSCFRGNDAEQGTLEGRGDLCVTPR